MCNLYVFCTIFVISLFDSAFSVKNTNLRFVQIVGRHGNRTPLTVINNDTNSWDGIPLGFLTIKGMNAVYEAGMFLRNHYGSFLSPSVDSSEIYARSTDKDRTLKSAQLLLAGLYPPKRREKWNDGLGQVWEPVAVHTLPQDLDPFVDNYPIDYCPRFKQLMGMFVKTPEGERMYARVTKILDVVSPKGITWTDYNGFLAFADSIYTEVVQNRSLPLWLEPYKTEILDLFFYFTFTFVNVPEMRKLAGGYLIYEIMNRNQGVVTNNTDGDPTKIFYYSAHDYTLMFVMAAFGIFNDILPPFTSLLLIELYEDSDSNQFYIQVLYRNDTNADPYHLYFPKCPNQDLCNFNDVWDGSDKMFIADLPGACQPYSYWKYWTVLNSLIKMYP